MITSFHTRTDVARLEAEGVDPDTVQPRERGVQCRSCRRVLTWNLNGRCDAHQLAVKP